MEPYSIHDLYDFLCEGTSIDRTTVASASFWHGRAEKIKSGLPAHNKQEIGDKKKLCEFCLVTFSSENGKKEYDEYLIWRKLADILKEVKQVASATRMLVDEQAREIIDDLYHVCGDKEKAIAYLKEFCLSEAIAWASEGAEKLSVLEPCPYCTSMIETTDKICPECGSEIIVECTQCGNEHSVRDRYCKNAECRYDFTNFTRAVGLCEQAKNEITILSLTIAKDLLDEAEHLCASVEEIAILRAEWTRQNTRFGKIAETIRSYTKSKRFVTAKRELDTLKRQFPLFCDTELEEKVAGGINAAASAIKRAKSSADPKVICTYALTAYQACNDYPGIQELLAKYPPKQVTALSVRVDGINRANYISWRSESDETETFRVIRKKGAKPFDVNDGEVLTETSSNSFTDDKVVPGETYYYGVVAFTGPVLSKLTSTNTGAINLFEVQQLSVHPSDASIQASWSGVTPPSDIEVWRCLGKDPLRPGNGDRVKNINNSVMLDQSLENDTEYTYRIFVKYTSNGSVSYSSGITFSAIPTAPPQIVDYIMARHIEDGRFELEWDQPDGETVAFYLLTNVPSLSRGDVIDIAELSKLAVRINIISRESGKGEFTLPGSDMYFLIAATQKNNTAVVGAIISVSSQKLLEIERVQLSGTDTYVRFDWPSNIKQVLLLYRTDRYPISPQDTGATRQRVAKAVYDLRKAIAISNLPNATYYFSLFAEMEIHGAITYSVPANYTFSLGTGEKIIYEIKPKKAVFGSIIGADVLLRTTAEDGGIPALVVYANNGSLPFFRNQGSRVAEIPAQRINGELVYRITVDGLTRNTFLRVFAQDEKDELRYEVSLKLGSRPDLR